MKLRTITSIAISGAAFLLGCSNTTSGQGSSGSSGSTSASGAGSGAVSSGGGTSGVAASGSSGMTSGSGSGATGDGGSSGVAGDSGLPPPDTTNSVLERGKHPSRDGQFVQAMLTKVAAMRMMPDAPFNTAAVFTGGMWASPLYLEQGPGGVGVYIVATTGNDVIALNEAGTQVWKKNIGLSATAAPTGWCGNIHPIGILSTPVIDPTPGADGFATIYVSGAIAGAGNFIDHHEAHALSAKDGSERAGWPVRLDGTIISANDGLNLAFNPAHNQRGALSLVKGILYIPFGGHDGDCNTYHGWVIAVDTATGKVASAWATRGAGGAIWAAGGMASDGNGVFAVTGNANYMVQFGTPPTYMDSNGILRISGTPLTRSDQYHPARWHTMDTMDQDMGASSSLFMQVPGATPTAYVVTVSKDGHAYFLDSQKLGSTDAQGDGHIVDFAVSTVIHSTRTSPVSYTTATGTHVALTVDLNPKGCPATVDLTKGTLIGLNVTPSANPAITVASSWCASVGGQSVPPPGTAGNRTSSPIVTTTDGQGEPVVWIMGGANATQLYGVDGENGMTLYAGGNCTNVHQWSSSIAVKGHIIAGGDGHLCSWSPH